MDSIDIGLQDFTKPISTNPHLSAVSIENITMDCEATATEYNRFADFLEEHSAITNIYPEAREALEPAEKWHSLWQRLLAHVQTNRIHALRGITTRGPDPFGRLDEKESLGRLASPRSASSSGKENIPNSGELKGTMANLATLSFYHLHQLLWLSFDPGEQRRAQTEQARIHDRGRLEAVSETDA